MRTGNASFELLEELIPLFNDRDYDDDSANDYL